MSDEDTELTPQERFDTMYITASEISDIAEVERSSVMHAKRRGMLPNPITIPGVRLTMWERKPLQPFLDAWLLTLKARRGELR